MFVKRSKHGKAVVALNKAVKKSKDTGTSIAIFPEGTRHLVASDGGDVMLPFKKGAFHMAMDAGIPILPVVVSEYDFIDTKHKKFGGDQEVYITILKPIETSGITKTDIDQLVDDTRSKMIDTFKEAKEQKHLRCLKKALFKKTE